MDVELEGLAEAMAELNCSKNMLKWKNNEKWRVQKDRKSKRERSKTCLKLRSPF